MRPIDADELKDYFYRPPYANENAYTNTEIREVIDAQPTIEPERSEIIPVTKAVPSNYDCVNLSERVTATYYDEEHEEWSQKTVTIRDVLDSVCENYTVIEPERKKGRWRKVSADRYVTSALYIYRCSECSETFVGAWNFCANCGADMRSAKDEDD